MVIGRKTCSCWSLQNGSWSVCNTFWLFEVTGYSGRTKGHSLDLMKKRCRLDVRCYIFSERVVNVWNSLDDQCQWQLHHWILSRTIFQDLEDSQWVSLWTILFVDPGDHPVFWFGHREGLASSGKHSGKHVEKYIQLLRTLTILVYLHSFSGCCARNLRNSSKIRTYTVQGHPRWSILVSIENACNFLLVINSNFGRMIYPTLFEIFNCRISFKIAAFPTSPLFNAAKRRNALQCQHNLYIAEKYI